MSEGAGQVGRRWNAAWVAAAVGVGLLFLAVSVQKIWSSDTWWQLAVGRWIVRHGWVPSVDEFSFTAAGRPEIEMRWIWCTLLYLGWQVGPWLLCIGQAVLLGATWGILIWRARRAVMRPEGLLLIALGLAAGQNRWVMRPELVTYVMIAAYLVLLEGLGESSRTAEQQSSRWRGRHGFWLLPVLQVVWTNSHTLFVMGPVLCWTFAGACGADIILRRWRDGQSSKAANQQSSKSEWVGVGWMVGLAAAVTLACLVNPYFVRGAMFTAEIASESSSGSIVAQTIGEMQSPLTIPWAGWTWDLWSGVLLAVVVGMVMVRDWRRVDLARLAVYLGGLYLACKAQRGLGMFAVMGVWAGLMQIERAIGNRQQATGGEQEAGRGMGLLSLANVALGVVCAGAAWYVATDRSAIRVGAPRETGLGVVSWNTPEGAAAFLMESGAQPEVFNEVRDGGYLGWRSDGKIKVFVDGRTDVYGESLMRELDALRPSNWSALADKWKINTAVIPVKGFEEMVAAVASSKAWFAVHVDHRDVVFVRDTAANAEVIGKYKIDRAKVWAPRGPEPEQRVEGWKRLIGGRGRPWYTQGMASSFLAMGSLVNAKVYLERTLRDYPDSPRARAELAAIDRFDGHAAEGDKLAAGLDGAWSAYSDRTLAKWLMDAGRGAEAVPVLERAVRLGGEDVDMRRVLGDQYFQAGDFARAKEEYEAAVRLGLDTAAEWLKLAAAREKTGDDAGAVAAYRKTLEKDPSQYQIWNKLGTMIGRKGDLAGAAVCFERALKVKPDYEAARQNLEAARGKR